jgi:hypothetical protein
MVLRSARLLPGALAGVVMQAGTRFATTGPIGRRVGGVGRGPDDVALGALRRRGVAWTAGQAEHHHDDGDTRADRADGEGDDVLGLVRERGGPARDEVAGQEYHHERPRPGPPLRDAAR